MKLLLLLVITSLYPRPSSSVNRSPLNLVPQHSNVYIFESDKKENLTLNCSLDNPSSTVEFAWFMGNQELSGSLVNEEGSLVIPRIAEGDYTSREGVDYYCVARDNIGYNIAIRSRTTTVYYAYFTGFKRMPESNESTVDVPIPVALSSDVALECDILDAKPPPQIKWYNDTGAIQEVIQGNNVIRFLDGGRYLYMRNLDSSHLAQRYYCAVTNVNFSQEVSAPTRYILIDNLTQGVLKDYKQIGALTAFVGDTNIEFAYVGGVYDNILNRTDNVLKMNQDLVSKIENIGIIETLSSPGLVKLEATVFYSNSVATRNGSLTVNQVPRITYDIQSVQEHFTLEGTLSYTCEYEGFPDPRITFYFNGQPISNGSDVITLVVNNTLTIPSPQVSHSGIYQCIVSNEFGDDQQAWLLRIREPIVPQVQPYNLMELDAFDDRDLGILIVRDSGSTVMFSVDVVADPCPQVVWRFNGTRLGPSNETFTYNNACAEAGTSSPNWTFTLSVLLTAATSGSYTANFSNTVGSAQSPEAYFTHPEFITVVGLTLNETCLKEGSTVSLRCIIRGFPRPSIDFQRNDDIIAPESQEFDNYILEFYDQLAIVNVTMSDEGSYSCTATSTSNSQPVQVQAQLVQFDFCTAPVIIRIHASDNPRQYSMLFIECVVDGLPTPTVMWFKDGAELKETDDINLRISVSSNGSRIDVTSANSHYNGTYTCVASNAAGSASMSIDITIQVAIIEYDGLSLTPIIATISASFVLLVCAAILLLSFTCLRGKVSSGVATQRSVKDQRPEVHVWIDTEVMESAL